MSSTLKLLLTGCFITAGVSLCQASPGGAQAVYYVSPKGSDGNPGTLALPFKTLDGARGAVSDVNDAMTGDIIVYLRGGVYPLTSSTTFTASDSGTNGHNIIYQSYPGERPRLSGGKVITGWTSAGSGIYKASNVDFDFRQLYVNGLRAVRARTPNQGSSHYIVSSSSINKVIVINAGEIANWPGLSAVEMVLDRQWDTSRLHIESFTNAPLEDLPMVYVTIPAAEEQLQWTGHAGDGIFNGSPYYFENALVFLDAPGEWFLDTESRELFYKPRSGEDINNAVVVAPSLETLVSLQGAVDIPVHNIQFHGLTFEYTNWTLPSYTGYMGQQAGWLYTLEGGTTPPAAVHLTGAQNILFERDVFQHMGGMGVKMDTGDNDNTVNGCVFTDISGGGVAVLSMYSEAGNPETCQRNAVTNNWISRTGQDYFGSVGVYGGFPISLTVQHNEISDLPYTGVSVGWGWKSWVSTPTAPMNNIISYNKIHKVLNRLSDGSGIYTLAPQPGTRIEYNYVSDLRSYAPPSSPGSHLVAAIYLDETSNYITVQENVSVNITTTMACTYNDYIFENNNPLSTNTVLYNDVYRPEVVAAAGIEPAYRDIIPSGGGIGVQETISTMTMTAEGLTLNLVPELSPILSLNVTIPPGVLPAGTIVTVNTDVSYLLPGLESNQAALTGGQLGTGFNLSAGGLQPAGLVSVTMTYDPAQVPPGSDPRSIQLARYDEAAAQWSLLPTAVDTAQHTFTSQLDHFSFFVPLLVTPASSLSAVQVFPQPWEIGDPASAYFASALTFSNLQASASVKIFTLAGELVWQGTASPGGVLTWDGNNRSGSKAASGTYYAAFKSGGQTKTRRVVIIR